MTNKHAAALGKKGGHARKESLTPERRKEIGRLAATARWKGHNKKRPASA